MLKIVKDGKTVARSQNLRGLRAYASRTGIWIEDIVIEKIAEGPAAFLRVTFNDGAACETRFESFEVLQDWVNRWRNAYGVPLTIDGEPVGHVPF